MNKMYTEGEINSFEELKMVCDIFKKIVNDPIQRFPMFVKFIKDTGIVVNLPQREFSEFALKEFRGESNETE